jgi:hypothetical protein
VPNDQKVDQSTKARPGRMEVDQRKRPGGVKTEEIYQERKWRGRGVYQQGFKSVQGTHTHTG